MLSTKGPDELQRVVYMATSVENALAKNDPPL